MTEKIIIRDFQKFGEFIKNAKTFREISYINNTKAFLIRE